MSTTYTCTDEKDGRNGLDQEHKADESPEPDKPYLRLCRWNTLPDEQEAIDQHNIISTALTYEKRVHGQRY